MEERQDAFPHVIRHTFPFWVVWGLHRASSLPLSFPKGAHDPALRANRSRVLKAVKNATGLITDEAKREHPRIATSGDGICTRPCDTPPHLKRNLDPWARWIREWSCEPFRHHRRYGDLGWRVVQPS